MLRIRKFAVWCIEDLLERELVTEKELLAGTSMPKEVLQLVQENWDNEDAKIVRVHLGHAFNVISYYLGVCKDKERPVPTEFFHLNFEECVDSLMSLAFVTGYTEDTIRLESFDVPSLVTILHTARCLLNTQRTLLTGADTVVLNNLLRIMQNSFHNTSNYEKQIVTTRYMELTKFVNNVSSSMHKEEDSLFLYFEDVVQLQHAQEIIRHAFSKPAPNNLLRTKHSATPGFYTFAELQNLLTVDIANVQDIGADNIFIYDMNLVVGADGCYTRTFDVRIPLTLEEAKDNLEERCTKVLMQLLKLYRQR